MPQFISSSAPALPSTHDHPSSRFGSDTLCDAPTHTLIPSVSDSKTSPSLPTNDVQPGGHNTDVGGALGDGIGDGWADGSTDGSTDGMALG